MNTLLPSNPFTEPHTLHLPRRIGTPHRSMTKGDALGGGLILSPEHGCGLPGKRLQDRVSLLDTLDAAKRLPCGGVIPELDRVGWVLPQDAGQHSLVRCVR